VNQPLSCSRSNLAAVCHPWGIQPHCLQSRDGPLSPAGIFTCHNEGISIGTACICPPGWWGPSCECYEPSMACQNGGTAIGRLCFCPPGYGGERCDCWDSCLSCQNGGTPNGSTPIGTKCICPPGLDGDLCEFYNASKACQNGGTPVGIECFCPPLYNGARCELYNSTINSTTTISPAEDNVLWVARKLIQWSRSRVGVWLLL
uniref:EGF-like domain-containing protein n=1 Tax=Pelusios castaneus TaxID=367368 RepID=A0A8C8S7R6_9SAUR